MLKVRAPVVRAEGPPPATVAAGPPVTVKVTEAFESRSRLLRLSTAHTVVANTWLMSTVIGPVYAGPAGGRLRGSTKSNFVAVTSRSLRPGGLAAPPALALVKPDEPVKAKSASVMVMVIT